MRGTIKGAGFYLYRPNAFGFTPTEACELAASLGAAWVAPRVVGWASPDPVNEVLMQEYRDACDNLGLELGGWGYHVLVGRDGVTPPRNPNGDYEPEAANRAIERWGLTFYVVNSEKELKAGSIPWAGWAVRDRAILEFRAEIFWETLRDYQPDLPIGMTSYRFPTYHPRFIWDAMLDPKYVDFNQPQVYWMLDQRLGAGGLQLQRCVDEFAKISDLPISPIMGTYPYGAWYASDTQIETFILKAEQLGLESYGAYTLEHANSLQLETFSSGWKPETGENEPEEPENPGNAPPEATELMWAYGVKQGWWSI